MFCDEKILKVHMGVVEDDVIYDAFLDCYHDIAYHCTDGYRIVLETEHYAISLSTKGVTKEPKADLCENVGEWLQDCVEFMGEDEAPWVYFETTLFVDERVLSVTQQDDIYFVQFDDFTLKLIPHADGKSINGLCKQDYGSYNYVLGCDRHLKRKCPDCGGEGEILLDFVSDYVVRCKNCKHSTWAGMCLIDAIEDWNDGNLNCYLSDIKIE